MAHYERNINVDINDFIHTHCQINGDDYPIHIIPDPVRNNKANGVNDIVDIKVDVSENDIVENLNVQFDNSYNIDESLDINIGIEEGE